MKAKEEGEEGEKEDILGLGPGRVA